MIADLEMLADEIVARTRGSRRFLVAIAGPPGAGKSTLSDGLRDLLIAKGEKAVVLPMDGFHMDNAILEKKGLLARKGAPETFDVRAFGDILAAVRKAEGEVLVPVFDRDREIAIASARSIEAEDRIVLVEGNYLLLDESPWKDLSDYFDWSVFIAPPLGELERRLHQRWDQYGFTPQAAVEKIEGNDLPNARRILENSREADRRISSFR